MRTIVKTLRRLLGLSVIEWTDKNEAFAITWKITKEGKLLFDRRDFTPIHPMSKSDLEEALQRMLDKISTSGYPIELKAILIERHIAKGLWDQGVITLKHLQEASMKPGYLEVKLELLGAVYPVRVVVGTYYADYEFLVEGHPQGIRRVRDLPDILAIIGKEQVF